MLAVEVVVLLLALLLGMAPPAPLVTLDTDYDTGDPMTVTAYPSSAPPHYATDPGTRSAVTTDRQDSGRVDGEPLPAGELNATVGAALDWCGYMSRTHPSDGVARFSAYQVYDFGGGAVKGTVSYSGTEVYLQAASGFALVADTASVWIGAVSGSTHYLDVTATAVTSIPLLEADDGAVADHNATSGLAYAFTARQQYRHEIPLSSGGWTQAGAVAAHSVAVVPRNLSIGAPDHYYGVTGAIVSTDNIVYRMPLGQLLRHNQTTVPTAEVTRLISLEAEMATGATGDTVAVRVSSRPRKSSTDPIARLEATTSNSTGAAETVATTDNNGGTPIDVEDGYEYYAEIELTTTTGTAASYGGVRSITLIVDRSAAE